jgi:hypothetical protein
MRAGSGPMKIAYVTADLEFDSAAELSALVAELRDDVIVHLDERIDGVYRVALGLAQTDTSPEEAATFYCALVEKLSGPARTLWNGCSRRVLDIAFASGTEPECETYRLSEALLRRLAALGMSVAVTIYRAGAYSERGGGS